MTICNFVFMLSDANGQCFSVRVKKSINISHSIDSLSTSRQTPGLALDQLDDHSSFAMSESALARAPF